MKEALLQTTLVIVVDPASRRLLLGRKMRGFGKGKFTSFGGKVDPGEDAQACIRREFREEACIDLPLSAFEKVGEITFHISYQKESSFFCHIFRVTEMAGEAQETDEMSPCWFSVDALPLDEMWQDNPHWLPLAIKGQSFIAAFAYQPDNESLQSYHVQFVDGFGEEE